MMKNPTESLGIPANLLEPERVLKSPKDPIESLKNHAENPGASHDISFKSLQIHKWFY